MTSFFAVALAAVTMTVVVAVIAVVGGFCREKEGAEWKHIFNCRSGDGIWMTVRMD